MSIVIAAKFLDRIIVFSDTMISGDHLVRADIIPGQLKSIILNGKLSISYAGSLSTGLDVIREAKDIFFRTQNLNATIEFVHQRNSSLRETEFACDFIVVSHMDNRCLYRICDGRISQGADRYWIGNPAPIVKLSQVESSIIVPPHIKSRSPEEHRFRGAIGRLLFDPAVHTASGVGGFVFELLGSPFGHCYGNQAGVKYWDTVQSPPGLTIRQQEDRESGMTQFGYCTVASAERGAGVVGAFVEQARTGYIYRPTLGTPQKLSPCTLEGVDCLVTAYAREMDGFIND
jgi:hypothetical protein